MSETAPFVAVDWGTTQMRATLCLRDQIAHKDAQRVEGPGISRLAAPVLDALLEVIAPWTKEYGELDLLLCGMVGSSIGWRETPYLPCPVSPAELAGNLLRFEERGHRAALVPGLSCVNRFGQPDVMRGEETQVLGWMSLQAGDVEGARLLCLPGTHAKWVRVEGEVVHSFSTALSGELYSLLCQHSVLVPKTDGESSDYFDEEAFIDGVDVAQRCGGELLQVVFSTRSRTLIGENRDCNAASYLSGLIIGCDVWSALRFDTNDQGAIELIGERKLCEKYTMALERLGRKVRTTGGDVAAYHGFQSIVASLLR